MPKLLVINIAALSTQLIDQYPESAVYIKKTLPRTGTFQELQPSFPAVTCSTQATLTTGREPADHGIVGNGFFDRDFLKTRFWEQSDKLCQSPRIWDVLKSKKPDLKTAILFWQNSIGSNNDIILTPAPIHKHHGGMIQDCYSQPADLYPKLKNRLGAFDLKWYWGPFTSLKSSTWIADATRAVMDEHAPDLVLTYLPHLDYNQQRWGPSDPRMKQELKAIDDLIASLAGDALKKGYQVIALSDYTMTDVKQAVMINQVLKKNEFLKVRTVDGREYLDFNTSRVFAVVDHQIAHVYCQPNVPVAEIKKLLAGINGIEKVLDRPIDHPRAGELLVVSESDHWFAYPWWTDPAQAPDYARHVDIHNKPGYDPLELFFDWWHLGTSLDTSKIKGSHGRISKTSHPIFSSSFQIPRQTNNVRNTDIFTIIKNL